MSTKEKNYLAEDCDELLEPHDNSMTQQELRFFSHYLQKLNPEDTRTRLARFSLLDFQNIFEITLTNIHNLQPITDRLLQKIIHVPKENGGYKSFQMFSWCRVSVDKKKEWYVEIDAHDDALPLFLEFQSQYFDYLALEKNEDFLSQPSSQALVEFIGHLLSTEGIIINEQDPT